MNSGSPVNAASYDAPLSTASRQRLQKVFEHAQRCVEKQDHDYANKLFTQCLVEDPGNLIYLQHFLGNLQRKYGDNQKGSRLAGLKIKGQRSSLKKLLAKGDWPAVFQTGCTALSLNPWDILSLLLMATAYEQLGNDECELYCLRSALNVDAKDVEVNRRAGKSLERIGQFDQSIACWQRVKLALPEDQEARQAIARLSVEQTIDKGGYNPSLLDSQAGLPVPTMTVAQLSKSAESEDDRPLDVRLQEAIATDPTVAENYVHLADIYLHQQSFDKAEQLLGQGLSACGTGNLQIRERIEEVQLRRVVHQVRIAEQRLQDDPTEDHQQLAHRIKVQANQVELEVFAARVERDPKNLRYQYELGMRLKRAGKVREAISTLQPVRSDSRRGGAVLVELGECFQHIEQYKLALTHYEQAVEVIDEPDNEVYRKALYRAGVLATGMQEYDRAEQHLTTLAGLDFSYRDVADRLDKLAELRNSS